MSEWPTNPDGSNKRVGDMTAEQRAAVRKASNDRVMNGRAIDWWTGERMPAPKAEPIDFWQA